MPNTLCNKNAVNTLSQIIINYHNKIKQITIGHCQKKLYKMVICKHKCRKFEAKIYNGNSKAKMPGPGHFF